ncbi:MAG: molybdopterin-guanine dinucleotide biosynthesis protein B [Methanophagales archaeon ANME-1-THS]|nr:MAG: molybdopterin-guanine dinucleotide biosynthesis protein B [Methanophagales archaeon ANME-1-THS]
MRGEFTPLFLPIIIPKKQERRAKEMKVISIIGEKKSGKTTLIEYLIANLKEHGNVGCIKHAHELDLNATRDTTRFVTAGAAVVIGTSEDRTVTISGPKNLAELIDEMARSGIDFLLVEGFKGSDLPKITLSDFSTRDVSGILKRVDLSGNSASQELIREIVHLILSLEDYQPSTA